MAKEKDVTVTADAPEVQAAPVAETTAEIVQSTKKQLDRQPKYKIRLPQAKKGDSQFEVVGVNGYNIQIKKGEPVEVPESVFLILQNAQIV